MERSPKPRFTPLIWGAVAGRGAESRPGDSLPPEGPAPYREVGKRASRGQRAHVPAPVQHRYPGTPDLGTGYGRSRTGLAASQWRPDREPDRAAADYRSGTADHHAAALGPTSPRLFYRLSFYVLARVPHGEHQHAGRDERRFRARLCPSRVYPRPGLSPLQRGVSIRQTRLRPCREARLYRLSCEGPPCDGNGCLLDAADRDRDRFRTGDLSHRDRDGGSDHRLLQHGPIRHRPSLTERSTRRGVARIGEGSGLRPKGRVPRYEIGR